MRWMDGWLWVTDDTPGCTKEAQAFSKSLNDFKSKNAEVFGISRVSKA